MKKLFIAAAMLLLCFVSHSQTIKVDAKGNYYAAKDTNSLANSKPTGKTYTDSKGVVYPVHVTDKGKLFVVRVSKTTGKRYRYYLKLS